MAHFFQGGGAGLPFGKTTTQAPQCSQKGTSCPVTRAFGSPFRLHYWYVLWVLIRDSGNELFTQSSCQKSSWDEWYLEGLCSSRFSKFIPVSNLISRKRGLNLHPLGTFVIEENFTLCLSFYQKATQETAIRRTSVPSLWGYWGNIVQGYSCYLPTGEVWRGYQSQKMLVSWWTGMFHFVKGNKNHVLFPSVSASLRNSELVLCLFAVDFLSPRFLL